MWVRNLGLMVVAIASMAAFGTGCGGGGGGEVDLSDADEVMAAALRAVSPPGKVGHLKWEVSEADTPLAEAWIDADNVRFRVEHRSVEGEEGSFTVAVGEKWRTATYLAADDDSAPFPVFITAVDREAPAAKGIDNFSYFGGPYPGLLVQAEVRRVVGESTVDDRQVVVVEGRQAMDGDWESGTMFVTTVELDKETLLPVQFRSSILEPDGTEREGQSLAGFEWEALSPDDLRADFFSPDALFAAYSTAREELAEASKLGFDLYWLGERYEGPLDLYLWDVDADAADWPQLHYASEAMRGPEAVIIREGPVGQAQFGPPREMSGPNAGPIQWEQVTVQGQPATLYSRTDSLSSTYKVTYRWLVVTLGRTVIEFYPVPMSEDGQEKNPLNDDEAIVALAEDFVPVPDGP
jgi:hypothetical protein